MWLVLGFQVVCDLVGRLSPELQHGLWRILKCGCFPEGRCLVIVS